MSNSQEIVRAVSTDDDDACPVCLCSPSDQLLFVAAPCKHTVCQPCMERILLAQHSGTDLYIPTRGKCPICRCQVSLFDLTFTNGDLAYPIDTDISHSPIGGLVYKVDGRLATSPDFCFDKETPYIDFGENGDGETISFDTFHWHAKSRTFHGTLTDEPLGSKWDVVLQFSSDLRFISNGVQIVKSNGRSNTRYPLDGHWVVQWESGFQDLIRVSRNAFTYGGLRYVLDLSNAGQVQFEWPIENKVVQTAVNGVNLDEQPQGPSVGSRIEWKTSQDERITWTRQSVGHEETIRFGVGGHMYHRVDASNRTRPTYHEDSLWGNTFCQALKVGLASYHFLSPQDGAYISYENPLCARWPSLDDGTPVPSQVYFRNMSFDETEKIFRGTIEWQQDHGTTWQGCSKWIYEMKFDSEYTCIISGGVKSIHFGNDLDEVDMSTFGADLVYINAAIMEKFDSLMNEETDEDESAYECYVRVSQSLRARLQREGASVRTTATMNHVLTVRQQAGSSDPIDYNL